MGVLTSMENTWFLRHTGGGVVEVSPAVRWSAGSTEHTVSLTEVSFATTWLQVLPSCMCLLLPESLTNSRPRMTYGCRMMTRSMPCSICLPPPSHVRQALLFVSITSLKHQLDGKHVPYQTARKLGGRLRDTRRDRDQPPGRRLRSDSRKEERSLVQQEQSDKQQHADSAVAFFSFDEPLPFSSLQLSRKLGLRVYCGRCTSAIHHLFLRCIKVENNSAARHY